MNTSINFNEVRKLAAKSAKSRPILGCIKIQDGKALWTDSIYAIVMEGYSKKGNAVISLADYSIKYNLEDYPRLEDALNRSSYGERPYTEEIMDGEVIYIYEDNDKRKRFIDGEILSQIKKLITNKKLHPSISQIEINESCSMGKVHVDSLTKIYFVLKRREQ